MSAVIHSLTTAQFVTGAEFCSDHGFELELASGHGWIVRVAEADHCGRIVGCIDQLDDTVELMKLDGGFHWSSFATLQDALDNLVLELLAQPDWAELTSASGRSGHRGSAGMD